MVLWPLLEIQYGILKKLIFPSNLVRIYEYHTYVIICITSIIFIKLPRLNNLVENLDKLI